MGRGYAVLDFETTGFSPRLGDRVIEVGVVHLTPDLRVQGGMETLVDPLRDVGPTRVHGISAADVIGAPTFDQLAPTLLEFLDGRVVVGHNVAFDLRFLEAELQRGRYEVPEVVAIDTMQLSRQLLRGDPPTSYRLHDVGRHLGFTLADACELTGVGPHDEHSAFGDALVTALVLARYAQATLDHTFWTQALDRAEAVVWPEHWPVHVDGKRRHDTAPHIDTCTAAQVVGALGGAVDRHASSAAYADALDNAMSDRILTTSEIDALIEIAQAHGLDSTTLGSMHRGYFDQVVQAAWSDGTLTPAEITDIEQVAVVLGIDRDSVTAAMRRGPVSDDLRLPPHAVVVLTGEMSRTREDIEAEIARLGYVPERSVTKRTALVVAADPCSQSGKARRAHELGIPVLGEENGLALLRR